MKVRTKKSKLTSKLTRPTMGGAERLFRAIFGIPEHNQEASLLNEHICRITDPSKADSEVMALSRARKDALTSQEELVLMMRFGLSNWNQKTLEDVSKHLKVTRERVRQIEAKSLRKLRRYYRVQSQVEHV